MRERGYLRPFGILNDIQLPLERRLR